MRVLLLNQYFWPDEAATAQLATDLCEDLVAGGAEVTVVSSAGAYVPEDGAPRPPLRERWRGVDILRVPATALGRASIPRRLVDYASFYAGAAAQALRAGRHDVVIVLTTPPLLASLGVLLRLSRGERLVCWVQDVYPEIGVAFGVFPQEGLLTSALRLAARTIYQRADAVVALGEVMAERLVDAGAPRDRVHVIHNWADGRAIAPVPRAQNAFAREQRLGDRFVVGYSGNFGRGHDLDAILQAARLLRDRRKLLWLFIGEGPRRDEVAAAIARDRLNARLLPYQPRERLRESLSAPDVHLVTMRAGLEGLIVPSKLYGCLAAGRGVVFVGPEHTEAAQILADERCGVTVPPADPAALAAAVSDLARRPGAAVAMGRRGRAAFERRFDRPLATAAWARVCRAVAGL
ncbi:MAG: glycosyltransferase family 4 protein [Deltaproteobacteria bacterium]|nr:glycosyltransferase family 4 protein [Deltaproteobacteria bacterium]